MNDRIDRMRQNINDRLSPSQCEIEDESALHAGHAGAASGGGHYRIRLVSDKFTGLSRLARHRLVYDCLGDMMHREIHALAITALAPVEINEKTPS
jgi:BolA protein